MPASTAPAAKAAILALLAARPALASVDRRWGGPTEEEDVSEEMIWLGDVVQEGFWRVLGGGYRHERYTIGLAVAVRKYGDDEQATELRAWVLLDEVAAALNTDPWLGGLLEREPVAIESARQQNMLAGTQQWGALIVGQIRCEARFTL